MFDYERASDEVLAGRRVVAERVRAELVLAGLPTLVSGFDVRGDVSGVVVEVDEGGDFAGGVIVDWRCSRDLTARAAAAVVERRIDDPAIGQAAVVTRAMNTAVKQILTSAGFTVGENPQDPLSLTVTAAGCSEPR